MAPPLEGSRYEVRGPITVHFLSMMENMMKEGENVLSLVVPYPFEWPEHRVLNSHGYTMEPFSRDREGG